MVAFDTNVVVRLLVGDDPAQTKRADRAFLLHTKGGGVFVSLLVLAEVGWVLASAYRWKRAEIHERLERLVRTRGVVVEELELALAALEAYRVGAAQLADYLLAHKAASVGAELLTFDKVLAREEGVALL